MKTLIEYIHEAFHSNDLVKLTMSKSNIELLNKIEKSFNEINKTKTFSLGNKQDVKKLFKLFIEKMGYPKELDARQILKKYGVYDEQTFAKWLILNADFLKEHNYKIECIKDFNESELDKKYKTWKNSANYVEGKIFDKENFEDDEEERTMVVYDVNDPANPDTTLEYSLVGKVGKDTQNQITMFKVDWHYQTGLKFFDARPILAQNYIKFGKDKLEKFIYVSDDDLTEL